MTDDQDAHINGERTILFVDDNPAIRTIYTEVMTRSGFQVVTADSGPSCLEILREITPDLILLDIMMEPMDGWQTLREIRKMPEYADIPVVIITGKVFLPGEMKRYGPDIAGWIRKPIRMNVFSEIIQNINTELMEDQLAVDALPEAISAEDRHQYGIHRRRLRVLPRIYDGILDQCISQEGGGSKGWKEEMRELQEMIAVEERWFRENRF